jgi:hypothetical protein
MEDLCLRKQSSLLPLDQQPQQLFITLSLLSGQLNQLEQDLEFCRNLLVTLQKIKPYKLKQLPFISRNGDIHLYELIELINALRHSHIKAKDTLDHKISLLDCDSDHAFKKVHSHSTSRSLRLTKDDFYQQVDHALNHFHLSNTLQNSSLLSCQLVIEQQRTLQCDVLSALRHAMRVRISKMQESNPLWSRLLQAAYIVERANRQHLAERFHMASSTLRRHIKLARQQLAAELWLEEQHLHAAKQT